MTSDAIFDVYLPDNMFLPRYSDICASVFGYKIYLTCSFTLYTSGYVSKVTIQ
jgi:hypothetical protein